MVQSGMVRTFRAPLLGASMLVAAPAFAYSVPDCARRRAWLGLTPNLSEKARENAAAFEYPLPYAMSAIR